MYLAYDVYENQTLTQTILVSKIMVDRISLTIKISNIMKNLKKILKNHITNCRYISNRDLDSILFVMCLSFENVRGISIHIARAQNFIFFKKWKQNEI